MILVYIKTEWYKVKKSWQSLLGYLLIFILVFAVITGYKLRVDFKISGFDIALVSLGNIINSLILHFAVALVASLLFAGEFTNKTYKYIMIRPVSLSKLFFSKIIAVWYYAAMLIIFIAILSLCSGLLLWGTGVVHGQDYTKLDQGLLRILLYYTGTWVNMIFIISLSALFAVILKNQLSTVMVTMGLFMFLIISTNIIPDFLQYTPIPYFNLRIFLTGKEIQFGLLTRGVLITLFYSLLITTGSYLYLKNRDILV